MLSYLLKMVFATISITPLVVVFLTLFGIVMTGLSKDMLDKHRGEDQEIGYVDGFYLKSSAGEIDGVWNLIYFNPKEMKFCSKKITIEKSDLVDVEVIPTPKGKLSALFFTHLFSLVWGLWSLRRIWSNKRVLYPEL